MQRRRIINLLKVVIGIVIAVLLVIYGEELLNGLLDFIGV